jgi:ABC-type uncharacterized transport system auxiliary subunit
MTTATTKISLRNGRDEALRRAWLLLPFAFGLLLTGCLSRPALVRQTFALQNPPATNMITTRGENVLAVRTVDVSPLFAGRSLVYRTGPNTYQVDPYAGFLIAPDRVLAIPLRGYLRNSGMFQEIVEPGSPVRADEFLDVHVSELYGDIRQTGQLASVLSMRMIFFETRSGTMPKVLLQKDYSRRIPLKENSATAVVAGYDQALAEIMAEVASDLTGVGPGK